MTLSHALQKNIDRDDNEIQQHIIIIFFFFTRSDIYKLLPDVAHLIRLKVKQGQKNPKQKVCFWVTLWKAAHGDPHYGYKVTICGEYCMISVVAAGRPYA